MCYVHVAALVAEYLKRKGEESTRGHSKHRLQSEIYFFLINMQYLPTGIDILVHYLHTQFVIYLRKILNLNHYLKISHFEQMWLVKASIKYRSNNARDTVYHILIGLAEVINLIKSHFCLPYQICFVSFDNWADFFSIQGKGDLNFLYMLECTHTHRDKFIKASCSRFNCILQSVVLCEFLLQEVIW